MLLGFEGLFIREPLRNDDGDVASIARNDTLRLQGHLLLY